MIADSYISLYKEHDTTIKSNSSDVMNLMRDDAFNYFSTLGFRYFEKDYEVDFGLNINRIKPKNNPYLDFICEVPTINAHQYIVINDTFCENPIKEDLPEGVLIGSVKEMSAKYPDLVSKYYGKKMKLSEDGDHAFNVSFAQDGFFVYVPKNVIMEKPLQLINLMQGKLDRLAVSHNLIILEEGAKLQLLVCDHVKGQAQYLSNRITEVFVAENATYEHYKIESTPEKMTNICSLLLEQKSGSKVLSNIISLHNNHTVNTVVADIDGSNAFLSLNGLGLGDKEQHIINHTYINHLKPHSTSEELFKYILDQDAKGDFLGQILVAADAQKTSASQSNKNLCLSKTARMQTKPQLEVYADDVKCSHGATVGQLDEVAMFYLQARGISKSEAKMLLMFAFVHDVLENVGLESLHDRLKMLIEKRLRGELSKCNTCLF